MDLERAPKKRVMTDEVKSMLKTKRKMKSVRIKELEDQVNSLKPEPIVPKKRVFGGNNQELINRLSNLENIITKQNDEYRERKALKEKLKKEKKEYQEEKDKAVDEEEAQVVQKDIREVNHKINFIPYSNLFY
jgi:hypothetical protein